MARKKQQVVKTSLSAQLEDFLNRNMNRIFRISFVLTLLFGILLFDIRFSIAGDDSSYVERSFDFIHHFKFPGFQGPLYPIILSPFVLIFGIHAIPLKAVSLVLMMGSLWLMFRSFRNRVPALLLSSLLVLLPVCSAILYYASQTYSEALFMFLQALVIMTFFGYFVDQEEPKSRGTLTKQHLILACCVLALVMTRSIGYAAVIAITVYFLFKARWKDILFFLGSFIILLMVFNGLKTLIFGIHGISLSGELNSLLAKDYYHPEMGQENVHGFLLRFASNTNWYLSKAFYSILAFRDSAIGGSPYAFLTVLTALVLIISVVLVFRKNRYLLFTGIYILVALGVIFLIAHTNWKQPRFIIPYVPLMILMMLSFFYYILSGKKQEPYRILLPAIVALTFIMLLGTGIKQVKAARQITDRYQGLNPDLVNYCQASEWVAGNLPGNSFVACRKPSISFIYSNGRKFFGISRMIAFKQDELIAEWKKNQRRYYAINPKVFRTSQQVSRDLFFALRSSVVAFGMTEENNSYASRYMIFNFPDSIRERVLGQLTAAGVPFQTDPDLLKRQSDSSGQTISIIYPDSLVAFLSKANVTHVMTDNIRIAPDRKNEHIINMVEWFMNLVEFKYPEIRTKFIQIGSDGDEPASIYRLNYERYGIKTGR